jgi:hypothetical protein
MVKKTRCTITRFVRTLRGAEKGTKDTYHSSANDVTDKATSVEEVNPQIFRVGDIVEAQVSFIAVPLKDNKYKMIVVLRSVALLDASFSQVRNLLSPVVLTHKHATAGSTEEQNEQARNVTTNNDAEETSWLRRVRGCGGVRASDGSGQAGSAAS